ncbi:ABC transporter ATP-binding protein [Actinopolymorpha sp. B11F2]|uniref:ABC transporter ATP-binding protein n=1 Tax=Actinopolymorpha sp. B11F2 TaxID=3160862 RepID=UPI0032E3C24C
MRVPVRAYWQLLARYLVAHRRLLVLLAVVLFAGIGVRLLTPWFAARFIDGATAAARLPDPAAREAMPGLVVWAALFCVGGVLDQVLALSGVHLGSHVAWQATNRLREDVTDHCLRLDTGFHHDHGPGELVERVDGDVRELNNFFSQFALVLLGNLALIGGVLVVMLAVDWRIMGVFVGFTAGTLWILSRVRGVAAPSWQRSRAASADLYGEVEERFGGLADIRANGAGEYVQGRFTCLQRAMFLRTRAAGITSVLVGGGIELLMVVGSVAILAVAVALYRSGAVSLGTVFLMVAYTALVVGPLRQILGQIDDLQRATASIGRVRELLAVTPTISSGPGAAFAGGAVAVAVEDVSFGYPGRDTSSPVLRDLTFRLRPGEVLGLVGRTGAGKTTIARLLLRFYDPDTGRITFDGTDIRQARLDELRATVGVVTQDVQVFRATLRDNLTLFRPGRVPDERLVTLLGEVGLGDWYVRQPGGLDTVLASGSAGMSAGEAQLLAMVRVFVDDPGLVILDEPTSRLDPASEAVVERAWDQLFVGRTGVIIAHRLRTLERTDTILVLERGRISEYGPRAVLAHDSSSAYHRALLAGGLEGLASLGGPGSAECGRTGGAR